MEKNIKDYLHLYLGCEVNIEKYYKQYHGILKGCKHNGFCVQTDGDRAETWHNEEVPLQLLLRPLSDMTEEEMIAYLQILFSDVDDKIDADEFDLEMFYNDGGSMVDGDIEVGANISCRCYEGQIAIRNCGSTFLFDDSGELTRVINIPEGIRLLLSKHFDLFGLIESGLAIDKTKQLAK